MKTLPLLILIIAMASCNNNIEEKNPKAEKEVAETKPVKSLDSRISLDLNPMQKNHQLKNMRSHLEAVQTILELLSVEDYDKASEVAYKELGSTTEMKLMCASFGNEEFEDLGLAFHASADEMSEVFKTKDKNKSLQALAKTMNYCKSCHATFRQ